MQDGDGCVYAKKKTNQKENAAKPLILRHLARLPRLERGAFRLGGERSILLSYRRIYKVIQFSMHSRRENPSHLGGERSILLSYGNTYEIGLCIRAKRARGKSAQRGYYTTPRATLSNPALLCYGGRKHQREKERAL